MPTPVTRARGQLGLSINNTPCYPSVAYIPPMKENEQTRSFLYMYFSMCSRPDRGSKAGVYNRGTQNR